MAVLSDIFFELVKTTGKDGRLTIDATHLEAHQTGASLLKRALSQCIECTKGRAQSATLFVTVTASLRFWRPRKSRSVITEIASSFWILYRGPKQFWRVMVMTKTGLMGR